MRTTNLFIVRGFVGQAPKAFNKAAKVNVATDRAWTDTNILSLSIDKGLQIRF